MIIYTTTHNYGKLRVTLIATHRYGQRKCVQMTQCYIHLHFYTFLNIYKFQIAGLLNILLKIIINIISHLN